MRKSISSAALIAGMFLASSVQAASIEDRLDAIEKQLDGTSGGNFISAAKKKVDVTLYGQVSKAILFADDGENDDVFFVDDDISSTRFGIKAKAEINDEFSAGVQLEAEWQQNSSNKVYIDPLDDDAETETEDAKKRQMKFYIKSKTAGKLTLGHGSVAADGIAENDLSGTAIAGNSHMKAQGGKFLFWDKDDGALGAYSSIEVEDVFDHLDGGRKAGVRYDSPNFFGITLSATAAEKNYNDVAIRYDKKINGFEIKAGLAHTYEGKDTSTHNKLSGSASVMMPFGLSFTVAAGEKEFDDQGLSAVDYEDGSYIYGKVGYQFSAFALGKTSVSFDYGSFDDMKGAPSAATNYEGDVMGLQFVQKADSINTEFFAAYRVYELDDDDNTTSYDDVELIWTGARFKF